MAVDELEYKKNARNMALFVGLLVLIVAGSLLVSFYIFPRTSPYPLSAYSYSDRGYALVLRLNTTSTRAGSSIEVSAVLNSTSSSQVNLTASGSWALPQSQLQPTCPPGLPLGVGVMSGFYTQSNFSSGTMLSSLVPPPRCPPSPAMTTADYYVLRPMGDDAVASLNGTSIHVVLGSSILLRSGIDGVGLLQPGVYTVVALDEWGDAALTHLLVS